MYLDSDLRHSLAIFMGWCTNEVYSVTLFMPSFRAVQFRMVCSFKIH